jgi:hypothetical protein
MTDQRPNESLHDLLKRRERELVHQITAIHGQLTRELAPRERELAEVRQAMAAVGLKPGNPLTDLLAPPEEGTVRYDYSTELTPFLPTGAVSNATVNLSEQPTIKQLILRALGDQFRDEGATPAQLRTYIHDAYGREIDRTSMGPQLSRLREEGLVEQMMGMLNEGKWTLKLRGTIEDAANQSAASAPTRKRNWYGKDK